MRILILFLSLSIVFESFAQVNESKMLAWQDSLINTGERVHKSKIDPQRLEDNANFVKTLVSSLKEQNSFYFKFESLDFISIIYAPDQSFRIFSWALPLNDGSYLYYGTIQNRTDDGQLSLIPLLDVTFEIKDPEYDVLSPKTWYGAVYYDIIPFNGHYLLLGWKGHTGAYSQKVIEPLLKKKDSIMLGDRVFSDDPKLARKIFSFTKDASMYLKFDKVNQRIIFDHLEPVDPKMKGNYKYYGPDLTFDAYQLKPRSLEFQSHIEFQNEIQGNEDLFNDPTKPSKGQRSGLLR